MLVVLALDADRVGFVTGIEAVGLWSIGSGGSMRSFFLEDLEGFRVLVVEYSAGAMT